jgi:hypothetical protein
MKRWLLVCAALWAAQAVNAGTLNYYIAAPGVQTTDVAGAITETFEGAAGSIGASGTWAVGNYVASSGSLDAANKFGGAGGAGQYLGVHTGPITVTLGAGQQYAGFWWSAGDPSNVIKFYDQNDNLLVTFDTASLTTFLSGGGGVTSIGGTTYNKSDYFGNPNAAYLHQNIAQPYAYVHLRLTGTATNFKKVVLTGSNFELDNLAIQAAATPASTWVEYGNQTISDPAAAAANVPTLSQWGMMILVGLMALVSMSQLRQRLG